MNKWIFLFFLCFLMTAAVAQSDFKNNIRFITLDPGHFHAALVQKSTYKGVDSVVHVYAPAGSDVQLHLDRIKGFNNRSASPTKWKQVVYTGHDFLARMLTERKGNAVVIAGNNRKKDEYISQSIAGGFHVLADKPMAINKSGFDVLKQTFEVAKAKDLVLYDIMTERYEITTMLQKEFSLLPEVFGSLVKGTPDDPAVTKESVHYFFKYVSGSVLTRPAWFFDVTQEGEGIVDVTTHLVDLIQWECFPEQALDYKKDVQVLAAKRWSTDLTRSQFSAITKQDKFPAYLENIIVEDTILKVFSNGEINYTLKGVHAKVSVTWDYKAPEGAGDSHYSIMRGTKANLVIEQGKAQGYKPALYIQPLHDDKAFYNTLKDQLEKIKQKYPGIDIRKTTKGWEVQIPDHYKEGHEAHFARVTQKFLDYVKNKNMPDWEVPNMITKYFTTTEALKMASKN
ncbi:MAG TPA: putative oxidoreductase C-terminal domain-containing protein [Ohtaekwangia sp.]|nr:putative oxidoreductase C-terminal domain-containing protein [Ohtaekwangia sp.]